MEVLNKVYKAGFPGIVYAGNASLRKTGKIIQENKAERVVVLIDKSVIALAEIQKMFHDLGDKLAGIVDDAPVEPSSHSIGSIYEKVREFKCDLLIAIGGGSVMDMTKVIANAMTNKEFAKAGFMNGELIVNKPIPTIMIPTTSGTGAEATPNAIFLVPEQNLKVGVVANSFVASYVILDAALTAGLPPKLTASTGIDALCHAIESYISTLSNPISRAFSLKAVNLIASSIETAYHDGTNLQARENMLLGSFFAGLCLSSSSTVAVHALSYPLGGKYHIPHGVANAILLPWVLKSNLSECREAYSDLAKEMIGAGQLDDTDDIPEVFVEYIFQLCKNLEIPEKLTEFGLKKEDLDYLVDNAIAVERLLSKNPKKLSRGEIRAIYENLL